LGPGPGQPENVGIKLPSGELMVYHRSNVPCVGLLSGEENNMGSSMIL